MTRITCKEAAENVIQQHGFEGLAPINFDDTAHMPIVYAADDVEDACLAFVRQLSDEDKISIWYSCDDSLPWQEGLFFTDNKTKSEMLEGVAGCALYLTVKAMSERNEPI